MIWRGQDKGHGPIWPKPLSAHHFLRDEGPKAWDANFAVFSSFVGTVAGTQVVFGVFSGFREAMKT